LTIEHKDIVDPEIHEPRGITSAVEGSTYVADGVGSGAWVKRYVDDPTFAEIDSPAAVKSLTSVTDVLVDGFAYDDVVSSKFNLTAGSRLTILETGYYSVNFRVQLTPQTTLGANNETINVKLVLNSLTPPASRNIPLIITRNSISADTFILSANRIIDLTSGDYFEIYLNNAAATRSYSISAGLNLFKFGNI
jgi:hypothetical protein